MSCYKPCGDNGFIDAFGGNRIVEYDVRPVGRAESRDRPEIERRRLKIERKPKRTWERWKNN